MFGLDPDKTTILVTGGSQGARRLNELSAEAAAKLPPDTQVLHIAGALDFERVSEIAHGRAGHKVLGFCDQMPSAYALADLVIARSGASSLTEIAISGHPSILVPYPFAADDHQTRNAEVFAEAGAAKLVQERDLDAEKLASLATSILQDLPTYKRMAKAARALAIPDAAERVCAAIEATLSSLMNDLSQRLTDTQQAAAHPSHRRGRIGHERTRAAAVGHGPQGQRLGPRHHRGNRAHAGRRPRFLVAPHRGSRQRRGLVVFSSAIRPENPAYAAAVAAKIPLYRRAECLAAILHTRKGIIISGTHGKTTTSSMTAHVLREAGQKPSHYVGAEIPILGANAKWSEDGEFMVAEGDESDGTLALYRPEHSVILNIEAEHLDFYRDIDHIREVFTTLADQTRGKLVYCAEDPVALELCGARENAVSYGWEDADFTATDIRDLKGSSAFTVMKNGEALGDIELGIPGNHNILNALAAIAAGR